MNKWISASTVAALISSIALALGGRAVAVPSSSGRTATLAIAPCAALVTFALHYYSTQRSAADGTSPGLRASLDAILGGSWVAVRTLISNAFFGVRQRLRVPTQLGQYVLSEKIGEGGMGVVYKAQHAMLRRPAAVKLLPSGRSGAGDVARFEREVRLTSLLTHPNTIQIYDYGRTSEGTFYYAMEYLDGITLESLVAMDGPQPPSRVIAVLLQVCAALAEAHSIGLIHRDIKPANIMLCERGRVPDVAKVLDFGLVKVMGNQANGVSREGTLAGTPTYMAPEAIGLPDRVDARADLYALGAVGYFLATGHEVFEGDSVLEVFAHHMYTEPERPSKRLGAALPADFESAILACLAKSPDERPKDADRLRALLLACSDAHAWTDDEGRNWWHTRRDAIHELGKKVQLVSGANAGRRIETTVPEPSIVRTSICPPC